MCLLLLTWVAWVVCTENRRVGQMLSTSFLPFSIGARLGNTLFFGQQLDGSAFIDFIHRMAWSQDTSQEDLGQVGKGTWLALSRFSALDH